MKRRLLNLLVVAAVGAVPATLHAQKLEQTRSGFAIGFGIGIGNAGLDCDGCTFDRETAASGYLRIGGYIQPNLLLAAETNGWTKEVDGADVTISFLSFVAQYYPKVEQGFYLKGGVGISAGKATDGTDEITASGTGITLGVGYDWRVAKTFSLTPYANYLKSFGAGAKFNGFSLGTDLRMDMVQVGLGFSWH